MFPREFSNSVKNDKIYHRAIYFQTGKSNDDTIKSIMEKGISDFLATDTPYGYADKRIHDDGLQYYGKAECCAFTKTPNVFYLFPIHKDELANTGLDEQDLLYWINKLNGEEVGFKYVYFGEQRTPYKTRAGARLDWMTSHTLRLSSEDFYWVGVPKLGVKVNKPYLHWVALRYLVSTENSGTGLANYLGKGKLRLQYYNIPRVTVMLHEDFGVPFLKAFLYAHIANPFKSGNGLAYTDYMGIKINDMNDYSKTYQAPCVNVTNEQFAFLWDNCGDTLNIMLTQYDFDTRHKSRSGDLKGLKHLKAPYDHEKLYQLFYDKQYQEFINEIENSYKEYEEKVAI